MKISRPRVVELCFRHASTVSRVLVSPRPIRSTCRHHGMTVPVMSPQIGPGALKNHEYESRHLARPRQKFPPRKSRRPSLSRTRICSKIEIEMVTQRLLGTNVDYRGWNGKCFSIRCHDFLFLRLRSKRKSFIIVRSILFNARKIRLKDIPL